MSRELLNHPDFERYDTSSLLNLGGGGAQLQPDLVEKLILLEMLAQAPVME